MEEKKLTVVGNSLALIISKPFRKRLGLGRNTEVRVTSDGYRLIVEPLGDVPPPPMPAAMMLPGKVADELQNHAISDEDVQRLTRFKSVAYYVGATLMARDDDEQDFERMAACLERLRAGRSWDEAIADVIASA